MLACHECGTTPQDAVMVGDTTFDIETGKNVHALATIAVTHGFGELADLKRAQPDYIARDVFEVGTVLFRLVHTGSDRV
jgi:phosphoglycolate phosphatase-like HAD superfamily hydrolase